ncbi:MAG TPA: TolC family protein [Polyangia bacterium]|nr:TolC family protein [Polyangia bacterium]
MLTLAVATRVLTLADALHEAHDNQPQLRQARATVDAAQARADESRAPLLPQLTGTASYQRTTSNFVARPGFLPNNVNSMAASTTTSSFNTFNFWSFGLTLSQYIWDFGVTTDRWKSNKVTTQAQYAAEHNTELLVETTVRTAYFNARAQKALVEVAHETLANQERHLQQIEGFVKVGTRPEIDLAQARTDRANAAVQVITAENGYETAKAQLNQAMGIEGTTEYDVADETMNAVEGEDLSTDQQLAEAIKARPDLISLELQIKAQQYLIKSFKGGYWPTLGASMSLTDAGTDITNLGWNWNAQITASWALFQGLLTWSQVKEQRANLAILEAQRDLLRQQVRLDVDVARLAVRAAKAALGASAEALFNARERLRLAEGRYQAGVGSVIELGDAQVALTNAAAQRVQAEYNLATARAQLLKALGRR